jgi:hypothetical protein
MLVPPYGSGEAGLETIFDVKHLKKKAYFLDTQCNLRFFPVYASLIFCADRLPIPLGEFISKNVYDGKLRSKHSIADYSCVTFINVSKGRETKKGSSYLVSETGQIRIKPILEVDACEIEHGGSAYGCPDRQTI